MQTQIRKDKFRKNFFILFLCLTRIYDFEKVFTPLNKDYKNLMKQNEKDSIKLKSVLVTLNDVNSSNIFDFCNRY